MDLKKIAQIFNIPEKELENHLTTSAMLFATAGMLLAVKKGKSFIEEKLVKTNNVEVKQALQYISAIAEMMVSNYKAKESNRNDADTPNTRIYVAKNIPKPFKNPEKRRSDGEGNNKES